MGHKAVGTNSRHQVAVATEFCMVASSIFGSSVLKIRITFPAPIILRWLLDFFFFVKLV
jgi:hypothetical protein